MLKNKVSVITGGSRGIGQAVALKLAENGSNIAILYAGNTESAEKTVAQCEALGVKAKCYKCDVSDFSATKEVCDEIKKEFGTIDVLVNNAGITRDNLVLKMSEDDFDKVIDTNLKGAFNMIKHTYQIFMKKRAGKIINISSVSGIMGNAGQANYSSAKAGIIGLTKTVAKELAGRGVCVNAIAPGFVETDMTNVLPDSIKESVANTVPLKRMGKSEEIANVVLFLASDMSSYVTGEVIKVDGGLVM